MVYTNRISQIDRKLGNPAGHILSVPRPFPKLASSEWAITVEWIDDVFRQVNLFNRGLGRLEAALRLEMGEAPQLDACCAQDPLKLFELAFPSQQAFNWWKSLTAEQRCLRAVLHKVLLKLEKEAGYPETPEHDGVARFWGYIPDDIANQLIKNGGRFSESSLSLEGIFHGVHAHRIQLAVIYELIRQGLFRLPEGKNMIDLLNYIIDQKLWERLFDSNCAGFSFTNYLMSYLRNAEHLPCLRAVALFSFFKAVDKFMQRNQIDDYQTLVLTQACRDFFFISSTVEESLLESVKSRPDWTQVTAGTDYFFYWKRKESASLEAPVPEASSSSGVGAR